MANVGILHPGEMGISVAASAQNSGHTVYWASQGRSLATLARAEKFGLQDARSLAELCARCSILIAVCPPHAAEEVAGEVRAQGFKGLYVDANAISPGRSIRIGHTMNESGATYVDGGIIGGPAWKPGSTWLYLSGREARRAADCFTAGPLEASVLGEEIGKASALKMCYAAYTKGTTSLLCAILAAAEALAVREELFHHWARDEVGFPEQAVRRVRRVTAKAWRFEGEMDEIAATFTGAGLPGGFHAAAAEVYRRMAHFKDSEELPSVEEVLLDLIQNK